MAKVKQVESVTDHASKMNALAIALGEDMTKTPEPTPVAPEDILRSPSISVNLATGKDLGFRAGSMVMVYGPFSSMKTWTALEMCREAQAWRPDLSVAYIDIEHRVDLACASDPIGCAFEPFEDSGLPRFVYRKPPTSEKAWEYAKKFAASGAFSLIVFDSVAALKSEKARQRAEIDKGVVADNAGLTTVQLQEVAQYCAETGTIFWALNQLRTVGLNSGRTKKYFPGGAAWEFYPTHIIKNEFIDKEKEMEDTDIHILFEKNKYGKPMRVAEMPILYGRGIDREKDILRHAVRLEIIKKSGSWFEGEGFKLQGEDKVSAFLRENPALTKSLETTIYERASTN